MKVVILTPNFPNKKNINSGIFIYQQIKAMADLGVECHVLIPYNWFPPLGLHTLHPFWKEGKEKYKGIIKDCSTINIHPVPVYRKLPNRIFKTDFLEDCFDSFLDYLKKEIVNFDWIYGHFLTDFGYLASKLGRIFQSKVVTIARGDDVHSWPIMFPELMKNIEYAIMHSDIVLANSESLLADVKKFAPTSFKGNNLFTIYNGIDLNKFYPFDRDQKIAARKNLLLSSENIYILSIGRAVRSKGWLKLFDLLKRNKDENPNLRLVCLAIDSNDFESIRIEDEIKNRGLKKEVIVISELEHNRLPDLYNAVNGFCLLSENEGFANVILEASACNLPLFVTDVGGNKELFESCSSTVFINDPDNTESMDCQFQLFLNLINKDNFDTREKILAMGTYEDNAAKLVNLLSSWQVK